RQARICRRRRAALSPADGVGGHGRGQAAVHRRQLPPAPEHHSQAMSRRRRILLGLLLLVVLAPTSTLYWVATTESGLRFLVERAAKVGPVAITTENVSGTLTGGVRIG